ncbi:unnamed protein product [Owenia fusiformis]|uniref:ubiquitinyl hydrolase 1 n=1 Tax=Owenia fusiformis TaxID=6347 RepID=A0A8S4NTP7_OWEFU|nr:unnamed protein product [Owenia fusiformis]
MTILPKKKASKDKNEAESSDHSKLPHTHSHPHTSTGHPDVRGRSRNSPPRWANSGARDDRVNFHDSGGALSAGFEDYDEGPRAVHKRRHRSPPHGHRHNRKHRHERRDAAPSSSLTTSTPHTSQDMEVQSTSGYNSEDEYTAPNCPDNIEELEAWFEMALKKKFGLIIKRMGEDGACLFRAIADQVFGDQEMHSIVRKNCVDHMAMNIDFFSQYVTEDFTQYLNRKRSANCHGNHLEMQALSEVYNRPIEVYQYSLEPINTFHGAYKTENAPIRLSYHRGQHYNSIVDPHSATIGVGLGLPGHQPGAADKNLLTQAKITSEAHHIEQQMLEDKKKETDWEVTQETIQEQVARESYMQWCRDNEKRAMKDRPSQTASAACSSAAEAHGWWDNFSAMQSPTGRGARSPRNRSANNSLQNSPLRQDPAMEDEPISHSPADMNTLLPGSIMLPKSPKVETEPIQGTSSQRSPSPPGGAVGGAVGGMFGETSSLMDPIPPGVLGISDWGDDDVLAQVIAQSQVEYIDSFKKNANRKDSDSEN